MGSPSVPIGSVKGWGKLTQNAGTVITRLITPMQNMFTRLLYLVYTAGATAHTLTVMRPLGVTTFTADAASGQAVVNIAEDPGAYSTNTGGTPRTANNGIAANDFVVYEAADGTYVLDTVSSVSTLAITLSNNLPTGGVVEGGKFWFFGVIGDTNPADALAHPQFTLAASTVTTLGGSPGEAVGGIVGTIPHGELWADMDVRHDGKNQPLIIHSGNATNAGVLEQVVAAYSDR